MKKLFTAFLAAVLLLSCVPRAYAAEEKEFFFELSVDGSDTKQVQPGDVITVVFHLLRTDADAPYEMYAMQNEIRYDSSFFRLVEGSALLSEGIQTTDLGLRDTYREFYMNFLSLSGGEEWPARRLVGSFQLEVVAQSGVSKITNQDFLVSTPDGGSHYPASCQDITVIVSTDCTVTFESNGGTEVPSQTVRYGERVQRPQDPVRKGHHLEGWYRDIDLKTPWDFERDTVQGNMTLYAKWGEGDPSGAGWLWWLLALLMLLPLLLLGRKTVAFETGCQAQIPKQHIFRGGRVRRPEDPVLPGKVFGGWYADEGGTLPWEFDRDTVRKRMTLYAKWL